MEDLAENPPAEQPSISMLNEYCLINIFQLLELQDFVNLAKTCARMLEIARGCGRKLESIDLTAVRCEEEIANILVY